MGGGDGSCVLEHVDLRWSIGPSGQPFTMWSHHMKLDVHFHESFFVKVIVFLRQGLVYFFLPYLALPRVPSHLAINLPIISVDSGKQIPLSIRHSPMASRHPSQGTFQISLVTTKVTVTITSNHPPQQKKTFFTAKSNI